MATLLTINGQAISADEAAALLRQHLGYNPATKTAWYVPIVNEVMIRRAAEREGIPPVTDAELQRAADETRQALGLYSVADTEAWLARTGMTLEDFEHGLETNLLADQWAEKMVGSKVDVYFAENRHDFDRVTLSQIVVADESIARELKEQIDEADAEFATLARAYSTDPSADIGGYLGWIQRASLSGEVAGAVFGAGENTAVGPFRSDQGYHLLYVHGFTPAQLDDALRRQIRATLMEPILEAEWATLQVEIGAQE